MMNSSINDRIKALKQDGNRIIKLMAYSENDYDRIMDHVKSSYPGATFTPEANPTIHLPYSKGGLKFSLLGYKLGDGDQGGEFPLMEAGSKLNLVEQTLVRLRRQLPRVKTHLPEDVPAWRGSLDANRIHYL